MLPFKSMIIVMQCVGAMSPFNMMGGGRDYGPQLQLVLMQIISVLFSILIFVCLIYCLSSLLLNILVLYPHALSHSCR